jgi:hypothetical protein
LTKDHSAIHVHDAAPWWCRTTFAWDAKRFAPEWPTPVSLLGKAALAPRSYLVTRSSAAGDGHTQEKRNQQRTKRRFARDVAQYAQGHAGLSTRLYRVADTMDGTFRGLGDFGEG